MVFLFFLVIFRLRCIILCVRVSFDFVCGSAWSSSCMVCFSSTSFSHRRNMGRFCGYHHLGCADCADCADCAFGSWSDLSSLIDRNHFLLVCLGSFHDCNCYSGACYYRSNCRTIVVEGRNDFVLFVFVVRPFSPFVRFYCFSSEFVRHGVDHDGSISCCIFDNRRLVGIRVRFRSIYYLWVLAHLCLFW
jgi:hypothetical protein